MISSIASNSPVSTSNTTSILSASDSHDQNPIDLNSNQLNSDVSQNKSTINEKDLLINDLTSNTHRNTMKSRIKPSSNRFGPTSLKALASLRQNHQRLASEKPYPTQSIEKAKDTNIQVNKSNVNDLLGLNGQVTEADVLLKSLQLKL